MKVTLKDGTVVEGTSEEIYALDLFVETDVVESVIAEVKCYAPLAVGDYVVVVNNDGLENNVGDVVVLTVVDDSPTYPYECAKEAYMPSQIRKATDEEVASAKAQAEVDTIERKRNEVFTTNGRKVNEYRKGDIVKALKDNGHGAVAEKVYEVSDAYDGIAGGNVVMVGGAISLGKDAEIVTFAENRLDRK